MKFPKINDLIKKWETEFFQRTKLKWLKKHIKKCSLSLATKEMQINTTLRFHLVPVRIATIKNNNTNVGKDEGKRNTYTLLVGM
jgi:hypothetical protein